MNKWKARALLALIAGAAGKSAWAQYPSMRSGDSRTMTPESVVAGRKEWGTDASFGGNFNRGNVDVDYMGGGFALFRTWAPCTAYLSGKAIYNTFNGVKVQNQGALTARLDHSLGGPWKIFVFDTNGYNYFTRLNYRSTSGAGPWYDFSLGPTHHGVSLAMAYEYESFRSGVHRRDGRVSFRDISRFPISKVAEFRTDFFYVPQVDLAANYRLFGEIAFETLVWKEYVGLQFSWTDEYENQPQMGVKKNDAIWMTSLTFHMGR